MEKMIRIVGNGATIRRPLGPDDMVILKTRSMKMVVECTDRLLREYPVTIEYKLLLTESDTTSIFWTNKVTGELLHARNHVRNYDELIKKVPVGLIEEIVDELFDIEWCNTLIGKKGDISNLFHVDLIEVE